MAQETNKEIQSYYIFRKTVHIVYKIVQQTNLIDLPKWTQLVPVGQVRFPNPLSIVNYCRLNQILLNWTFYCARHFHFPMFYKQAFVEVSNTSFQYLPYYTLFATFDRCHHVQWEGFQATDLVNFWQIWPPLLYLCLFSQWFPNEDSYKLYCCAFKWLCAWMACQWTPLYI